MNENWQPMAGYPYFEINDDGIVRSKITQKVYGNWNDVKRNVVVE